VVVGWNLIKAVPIIFGHAGENVTHINAVPNIDIVVVDSAVVGLEIIIDSGRLMLLLLLMGRGGGGCGAVAGEGSADPSSSRW